jgi:hypothetical protein
VTEIEEDSDDYSDPEDYISPEEMESLEAEVYTAALLHQ